jgi:hypothetical protein
VISLTWSLGPRVRRARCLVAVARPVTRLVIGSGGMTMTPSLSAAIPGPPGFDDGGADHLSPAASNRSCRYAGVALGAALERTRTLAAAAEGARLEQEL